MQVGHRSDEPNALAAARDLEIAGRTIRAEFRLRNQRAKLRFERAPRFGDREKVVFAQDLGRAHGHQFDKSQEEVALRGEISQRDEAMIIASAHQNGVDLYLRKSRRNRGVNAGDRLRQKIASGDASVLGAIEGIERDVDRVETAIAHGLRHR